MLAESHKLHKYHHDASATLDRIADKKQQVPEELGQDYISVEDYMKKHDIFAQDLQAIRKEVSYFELDFPTSMQKAMIQRHLAAHFHRSK